MLRSTSGRLWIAAASIVREISGVAVFTSVVAASTVTDSVMPPISSDASTRAVSFTRSTMPLRVTGLNPERVTSTT